MNNLTVCSMDSSKSTARTSSHANRARVAAALGKWMDEGAKKKPKVYGKRWPGMKVAQPKGANRD